jgi:hypothetical protein
MRLVVLVLISLELAIVSLCHGKDKGQCAKKK